MSYTTGYKVRVGAPVKAAADLVVLKDNWDALNTKFKFRGVFVLINAYQAFTAGASAFISWNIAAYDTDSAWSSGSPTIITPPAGTTYVRVGGNLQQDIYNRTGIVLKTSAGARFTGGFEVDSHYYSYGFQSALYKHGGTAFKVEVTPVTNNVQLTENTFLWAEFF